MLYLEINDKRYEASFTGKQNDLEWDNRASKTITTFELTLAQAQELFHDDVEWFIVEEHYVTQFYAYDKDGNEITELIDPETGEYVDMYDKNGNKIDEPLSRQVPEDVEYDNSKYDVCGDFIQHTNGSISIKMGKTTELEEAYELLYGGM